VILTAKSRYGDDGMSLPLSDTSGCNPCPPSHKLPWSVGGTIDGAPLWRALVHHPNHYQSHSVKNQKVKTDINHQVKFILLCLL